MVIINSLQVKYFLALCSERSFSKAAQKLYVTQPSFSQFIKKIETEVGTELVDRSCSPVKLTEAGEAYRSACVQFAAVEEDMLNEISSLSQLKSGRLTVGTTSFRASTMLAKSVAAFKKEYSGVDISIVEGSSQFLAAGISGGEIDLAICSGEFDESIFHSEILADERIYAAVHPDLAADIIPEKFLIGYSDIKGNSLKILKTPPCPMEILGSLPYIQISRGESFSEIGESIFIDSDIRPNTVLSVQNLNTAMSLVLEKTGFMFCPDTMIKFGNMDKHPSYYAVGSRYAENKICLVTRRNRYLSKAAEEYGKILKQLIRSGTWRI